MSVFVEVNSVEKKCKVIVNLDMVVEIAPLTSGGCILFFADNDMKVSDNYPLFQQFAMQTVSSEDIANRIEAIKGRGRPKATVTAEDIPKL